jgi:hypothetical protein
MRKLILLSTAALAAALSMAGLSPVFAANGRNAPPVIPCDQPGANPGGTRTSDATSAPCNVGIPHEIGNTSVTAPPASGDKRLPATSRTKQLPPPHNPNSPPSTNGR